MHYANNANPISFVKVGRGLNPRISFFGSQQALTELLAKSGSSFIRFVNVDLDAGATTLHEAVQP